MIKLERALFNMKEANAVWRSKLLGKAAELHEQWKSYLVQYATTYATSEKIYRELLLELAYQKYVNPKSKSPSSLFDFDLLSGVAKPQDLTMYDPFGTKLDPGSLSGREAALYKVWEY
jgi:hypothetical protein